MEATQQKTVLLVDGYSLIFRGFHALPLLSSGEVYTNAIQGFFSMLLKALADYRPHSLCVMLDTHAPTFRHTLYDGYKATRKPMPQELRPQIPIIQDILTAMGVAQFSLEGYEADDLLGTAARLAGEAGWDAYILTGDRDSFQLVEGRTRVILTKSGIKESLLLDPPAIQELYGYTPAQAIDMKALMGDSSDNIPGIAGVGEKTALKLITQYGTLDSVLAHAGEVKGKLGEKLQKGREAAELSRTLGTICRTVPLQIDFDACGWSTLLEGLPELEKYQLNSLSQRVRTLMGGTDQGGASPSQGAARASGKAPGHTPLRGPQAASASRERAAPPAPSQPEALPSFPSPTDRGALTGVEAIKACIPQWLKAAQGQPLALLLGREEATLAAPDGQLWHMPLALDMTMEGLYEDQLLQALAPLLREAALVVHGAKELWGQLARYGLPQPTIHRDTLLAAYLLHPGQKSFGLDSTLAVEYGQEEAGRQSSAASKAAGKAAPGEAPRPSGQELSPPEEKAPPTAWDLYALSLRQEARLAHQGMLALLNSMEQPLTQVLFSMEREGFGVDVDMLAQLGVQFTQEIDALVQEVYTLTGVEGFNLNSPKQLGEVLFDKLGLPAGKKGKAGAYSTDASVLEGLADYHPAIGPLLRYRKLSKLQNTYIEGLRKVTGKAGRVHTTFDQTGTLTGRISSLEPNLQNIPIRSEEGREIRKAFVAKEGCLLVDADYSQIELRVLAHLSGDPAMQDAFRKGQDIHTRTASEIFGIPMEEVSPLMRRRAKAVNFGIVYGISGFGLARNTGITRKEADQFIATYFERYPGVHAFMEASVEQGYQRGYAETLFHRRRALPELQASNHNVRSFGERAAMNTPVQGTAADIIKLAMCRVYQALSEGGYQARLILQVHDELVVETPQAEVAAVSALLQKAMEGVAQLAVPLVAEVSHGRSWYDAH